MPNTVEHPVRKSRLSLSLKKSNDQAIAVKDTDNDKSENFNELNTFKETTTISINNESNNENEEEEMIPCSLVEDNLVFSQKTVSSDNCNEAQTSIVLEQRKENYSSLETYLPDSSSEHDKSKDSSLKEDKVNDFEDENSTDLFNSPEAKVSKIPKKTKDDISTEELNIGVKEKVISQNSSNENTISSEVDVCTTSDENEGNTKMDCSTINEETTDIQEECNEIPNSPDVKIFKIIKDNEVSEESKCEREYDHLPIMKRNVIIADSDEEFEEFVNPKRKFLKKTESKNISNSQKENSASKSKEQTKASSCSSKEKTKALKSHRDKNNISKTSKQKSKDVQLKRKLESVAENSEDEFEKPLKKVKTLESPQSKVKKSKKLKKSRKSV